MLMHNQIFCLFLSLCLQLLAVEERLSPQVLSALEEDSQLSRLLACRSLSTLLKLIGPSLHPDALNNIYPGTILVSPSVYPVFVRANRSFSPLLPTVSLSFIHSLFLSFSLLSLCSSLNPLSFPLSLTHTHLFSTYFQNASMIVYDPIEIDLVILIQSF